MEDFRSPEECVTFPLSCRQFCGQAVRSRAAICRQLSATKGAERMVEGTRRKMLVEVRLENRGENAYNAHLNITYSPNLRFSSLIVKVGGRGRIPGTQRLGRNSVTGQELS